MTTEIEVGRRTRGGRMAVGFFVATPANAARRSCLGRKARSEARDYDLHPTRVPGRFASRKPAQRSLR